MGKPSPNGLKQLVIITSCRFQDLHIVKDLSPCLVILSYMCLIFSLAVRWLLQFLVSYTTSRGKKNHFFWNLILNNKETFSKRSPLPQQSFPHFPLATPESHARSSANYLWQKQENHDYLKLGRIPPNWRLSQLPWRMGADQKWGPASKEEERKWSMTRQQTVTLSLVW